MTKHLTPGPGLVVLLLVSTATVAAAGADRPNIVLVLADDLGWHDVGFNGEGFFETPNIDQLAADGIRFNRAYSGGPNCLPTRVCLMTGMYTPRVSIWTPGGKSKGKAQLMRLSVPGPSSTGDDFPSRLHLAPEVISVAEVLNSAGYATARFGKWHLGPDHQGFDISDPNGRGGKPGTRHYDDPTVADALTDASLAFIESHRDQPFLLYLAHWDVHTPIVAKEKVVQKYQRKLGADNWQGKNKNPTYAAMIEAVDTSVGRVRAKLRELNLDRNTLFIFSSDNGGQGSITSNAPLRGEKGALYEGGVRVPTCMSWPDVISVGSASDTPITSVDFLPTAAEIAGAPLPKGQPVDGQSLVGLLRGEDVLGKRAIFWHYPLYLRTNGSPVEPVFGTEIMYWRAVPASSICKGPWKLIECFEDNSLRLFNLADDVRESNNLASQHPAIAAELLAELHDWQERVKAPVPSRLNPNFNPSSIED